MILKKVFVCLQILICWSSFEEVKAEFSLRKEIEDFLPKIKEIAPRLHNLTTRLQMNMPLMHALNKVKNKEEFQKLFGLLTPALYTSSKSAEVVDATNVGCVPVKTLVDLTANDGDPSALYYPSCVLLEKCGGCCYGSLLSCQPVAAEPVNFKIMKVRPTSRDDELPNPDETISKELIIAEERHLECSCKCKIKAKDCDLEKQKYNENQCSCDCIDIGAEAECLAKEETHIWESSKCSCKCRKSLECSSGFLFDHTDCKCVNSVLKSNMRRLDFNDINDLRDNF